MTAQWPGQRVVLRSHPAGMLRPSDFVVEAQAPQDLADGQFLVRNLFISVDPMLRLFVDSTPLDGMIPAMPLGTTIPGAAVGEIIETRHAGFSVGELVEGRFGWQHYAASDGTGVTRVNAALGPPETALGIGGLPGFTAYIGLHVAGGVSPGQTVLVSGAAGAVGTAVGVLIRARGGRAVGIVGGEAKRRHLIDTGGYEAVADRLSPGFAGQLARGLPNGADVYFDNVGAALLPIVLPLMARGGLILVCGLMSQYQANRADGIDHLPSFLTAVMGKSLRVQGFSQYGQDALRPAFEQEMGELVASGRMTATTHVEQGIERLPYALADLFESSRIGKVVVQVASRRTETPRLQDATR